MSLSCVNCRCELTDDTVLYCEEDTCTNAMCEKCAQVMDKDEGTIFCPVCAKEATTEVVLIRQERRKPHQLVLVFPTAQANYGKALAFSSIYEGDCRFTDYVHGEVDWGWVHSRTRPCRDPEKYQPLLDYYRANYSEFKDAPCDFKIVYRVSHEQKMKNWNW